MPRIAGLILLLLFLTTVSTGVKAASLDNCPSQPAPEIDIQFAAEPVKYNLTKSSAQIDAMPTSTINPYEADVVTHAGGIMVGQMHAETTVKTTGIHNKNQICLWIKNITVKLSASDTIYIASEYPKGTCQYGVNLEHEHKHVAIEHQAAQEHIGKIRQAAQDASGKVGIVGPKPFGDAEMYDKKMREYVAKEIRKEFEYMRMDTKGRQKALDSKAEYDRASVACLNRK